MLISKQNILLLFIQVIKPRNCKTPISDVGSKTFYQTHPNLHHNNSPKQTKVPIIRPYLTSTVMVPDKYY